MSSDASLTLHAADLYDGAGDAPRHGRIVEIARGRIAAVRDAARSDARDREVIDCEILAPGFIDLQINGAADRQFNFDPTPETLERIAAGARGGGTALCLPTFITAEGTAYLRAIAAARSAIDAGVPGVLGLHLEGPFLSASRPGIHPAGAIRPLDDTDLRHLTAPFPGPMLLTVAPEAQRPGALRALVDAGRIVFAGHSEATAAQIAEAEAEGLRGVTHLFNAMSQMTGRAPGVVGAAMASDRLFAGIIADGFHVAWENVRIAARSMPDRLCLVTDAMLTLAGETTAFDMGRERIRLSEGRLTNPEGRLAGAHVAMDRCVANLVDRAGVPVGMALRMASGHPAAALGLAAELGRVRPGHRACLTALNRDMTTAAVVVDGEIGLGSGSRPH